MRYQFLNRRWLRRIAILSAFGTLGLGLSACDNTSIVQRITNTPDPRVIQITITDTPLKAANANSAATAVPGTPVPVKIVPATAAQPSAPQAAPATNTPAPQAPAQAAQPTNGALPAQAQAPGTAAATTVAAVVAATAIPGTPTAIGPAPTQTSMQVIIAHETFEHGYMFWISTEKQIWVLIPTAGAAASPGALPTSGTWLIFPDTFVDGEPEVDPAIIPPGPLLFQPRRGFGKLWRTNQQVHDALGWATSAEFGLTTTYTYQPGGYVDGTTKQWVAGPGTHFLVSISHEHFAFHEHLPNQPFGTWEKVG